MALVNDMEEHVRRVGAVGEIADFIDDQDGGMRVGRQRLRQLARAERRREVVDERGDGGKEGVETILNRSIGDGDREMGFAAARFTGED